MKTTSETVLTPDLCLKAAFTIFASGRILGPFGGRAEEAHHFPAPKIKNASSLSSLEEFKHSDSLKMPVINRKRRAVSQVQAFHPHH